MAETDHTLRGRPGRAWRDALKALSFAAGARAIRTYHADTLDALLGLRGDQLAWAKALVLDTELCLGEIHAATPDEEVHAYLGDGRRAPELVRAAEEALEARVVVETASLLGRRFEDAEYVAACRAARAGAAGDLLAALERAKFGKTYVRRS